MKVLYLNCAAGISGDMFCGALTGLLEDKDYIVNELARLKLENFSVTVEPVDKAGVAATKFTVHAGHEHAHRYLKDIDAIIDNSDFDPAVKELAKKIFLELGRAEAKAHDTTLDKVHFHEVGAIDSIVDVVSAAVLITRLAPDAVYAGPVSVGKGEIEFSHGRTELPVPAVREILKDAPLRVLNINKELTTPTGAAILRTIVDAFVDDYELSNTRKGYGAGTRNLEIPNVLEAVVGDAEYLSDRKVLLETNIDDMNPEFYEYVITRLLELGADDAFVQTCIMKKHRTGTHLTVLADERLRDAMVEAVFRETSTFGVRVSNVNRVILQRKIIMLATRYGSVGVKVGSHRGMVTTVSPEYEDCKRAAREFNVPIREVYEEARRAYHDLNR